MINRKAQRPVSVRNNLVKSRYDFLQSVDRGSSKETSDDEDSVSQHSSSTLQTDSGVSDVSVKKFQSFSIKFFCLSP